MRLSMTLIPVSVVCLSTICLLKVSAQDEKTEPAPPAATEKPADKPPEADKPDDTTQPQQDVEAEWNKLERTRWGRRD